MMVSSLLGFQEELLKKQDWIANPEEGEYLAALQALYYQDIMNTRQEYEYFNDKSLIEYMDRNERDSFVYVAPNRKDYWRARTRRQTPREKANAVIAAILDQNLSPDVFTFDQSGKFLKNAADTAQGLVEFSDVYEMAEEKRKLRAFELLKHGTVANEVSYTELFKVVKTTSKDFDIKDGAGKWEERKKPAFEGIWTKVIPLNRVILGDVTKYFIGEQPHIWKEYLLGYEEAYIMFNDWAKWKYVKPIGRDYDMWNDTEINTNVEAEQGDRKYVRMRVYENKWRDECAVILNDVLMTKPGTPLPTVDKEYSITWTQNEMFAPNFAYGRSFFAAIHNDAVISDFLYNALIDKGRQGMEPPIVSSFKNLLNKNIFRPGNVTQGPIEFKPLITHQGITNADIEIIRFVEENINKTSVSPTFQGQSEAGGQTAYEIREQQKASLRMLGLTLYSIARMERDIAEKKMPLILEHYPKMKIPYYNKEAKSVAERAKSFVVHGQQGQDGAGEGREITFGSMPETPEETYKMNLEMMRAEDESRKQSSPIKKYRVDPDVLRNLRYVFQVVVNPSQRKSKIADTMEAKEKYLLYIQNPLINPEWSTRLLLRAMKDDEDEALKKDEQGALPGGPPGAQPPGMPPGMPPGATGSPPQATGQPPANPPGMMSPPTPQGQFPQTEQKQNQLTQAMT